MNTVTSKTCIYNRKSRVLGIEYSHVDLLHIDIGSVGFTYMTQKTDLPIIYSVHVVDMGFPLIEGLSCYNTIHAMFTENMTVHIHVNLPAGAFFS